MRGKKLKNKKNKVHLKRIIVTSADDAVAPELQARDDVIVVAFERLGVLQRPPTPIHFDFVLTHVSALPFGRHQRLRRRQRRMRTAGG